MKTSINNWIPIYEMDYVTYRKKFRNKHIYVVAIGICIFLILVYVWFTIEDINLYFKSIFFILIYIPPFIFVVFLTLRYQRFGIYDKGIVPACKFGTNIFKFKVKIIYDQVEKMEKIGYSGQNDINWIYRFTTKNNKIYDIDTEQILWTLSEKISKKDIKIEIMKISNVLQFIYDKWKNADSNNSLQLLEQDIKYLKNVLQKWNFYLCQ